MPRCIYLRLLAFVALSLLSHSVFAFQLDEPAADADGESGVATESPLLKTTSSTPQETLETEQGKVTTGEAFLLKLKQGGRTMIFLLLCSVVAVACTFERLVRQRKGRIAPRRLSAQADRLWRAGDFGELESLARSSNSTLGRMLAAIVRHRGSGADRVSTIAGDIAARDLKRHLQRAYPLAVVATVSPLLGLFGTVLGMIGAFDKIAVMGELANPAAFGGDIGKALITTGAGLAIAIAALVLYHWFKSRISVYGVELEEQVSVLITEWFESVDDSVGEAE